MGIDTNRLNQLKEIKIDAIRRCSLLLVMAAASILFASETFGQTTYSWTGNGDGTSWDDADNWSPTGVPEGGAEVIFDGVTVTLQNLPTQQEDAGGFGGSDDTPATMRIRDGADVTIAENLLFTIETPSEFEIHDATFNTMGNLISITSGSLDITGTSAVSFSSSTLELLLQGGNFGFVFELTSNSSLVFDTITYETTDENGEDFVLGSNTSVTVTNQFIVDNDGSVVLSSGASLNYSGDTELRYERAYSAGDEWPVANSPANVTVNTNGTVSLDDGDRRIANALNFAQSGTIDLGANTLVVEGSVMNSVIDGPGTIADATTLQIGNESGSNEIQAIQGGAITLNNLVVDKSDGNSSLVFVENGAGFNFTSGASINLNNGILEFQSGDVQLLNRGECRPYHPIRRHSENRRTRYYRVQHVFSIRGHNRIQRSFR